MKNYITEHEGQTEFYTRVGIDPNLHHHTDGVDRGNLYENKLYIKNINAVLFQAIKYASRIRERGEKLPANIILNDLNNETAYIYQSQDLLFDIEKVYIGGASKNNSKYTPPKNTPYITIDYSTPEGLGQLLQHVSSKCYVKYNVDKNNILGLSQHFYKQNQNKDAFIAGEECEIRQPNVLKDRIKPYLKSDNLEFDNIMDCLNPSILQREQGAFYTPEPYVKEMQKMIIKAVEEVPEGFDFLIIDRCAGVGNLEQGLPNDILKNCVLSTLEANEYQILRYKFGDICSVVVPTTDALEYDIIPAERDGKGNIIDDFIRDKVNDPKCVIILVENPPFSEGGGGSLQKSGVKKNAWKETYVCKELIKEQSEKKLYNDKVSNDLANLFIWSGFKHYLTSPVDSYILFSPLKYWRNQGLVEKKFKDGFICNKKHFHASGGVIGCLWWKNIDDKPTQLNLPILDIKDNKVQKIIPPNIPLDQNRNVFIKQASVNLSTYYDKTKEEGDLIEGIICETNGTERLTHKKGDLKPKFNKNIIAYLMANNFAPDPKNINLVRTGLWKGHGFFLRKENFINRLPLFVTSAFPTDKWWLNGLYSKSFDKQGSYIEDKNFLRKCLIYTGLTFKNRCRTIEGSDNRFYKNELCFDGKTLANNALLTLKNDGFPTTSYENSLFDIWNTILSTAKSTSEYKKLTNNKEFTMGVFQIKEEINIKVFKGKDKKGKDIYTFKYPELNTLIIELDVGLKEYYNKEILNDLFEYELLK